MIRAVIWPQGAAGHIDYPEDGGSTEVVILYPHSGSTSYRITARRFHVQNNDYYNPDNPSDPGSSPVLRMLNDNNNGIVVYSIEQQTEGLLGSIGDLTGCFGANASVTSCGTRVATAATAVGIVLFFVPGAQPFSAAAFGFANNVSIVTTAYQGALLAKRAIAHNSDPGQSVQPGDVVGFILSIGTIAVGKYGEAAAHQFGSFVGDAALHSAASVEAQAEIRESNERLEQAIGTGFSVASELSFDLAGYLSNNAYPSGNNTGNPLFAQSSSKPTGTIIAGACTESVVVVHPHCGHVYLVARKDG